MIYNSLYYGNYPLLLIFVFILGIGAQILVKSKFSQFSRVKIKNNLTGADVARKILDRNGLQSVMIEPIKGSLSDHYDPRTKILKLSEGVYFANSISAVGVAAHEAGHAIQDKNHYWALGLRNFMVPTVQFGSMLGPIMIMIGFGLISLSGFYGLGSFIVWLGILGYFLLVLFTIITLPVEFDASNRAKKLLIKYHIVDSKEINGVNNVLNAAALTYVVSAISAILELVRWIMILNRRRD